MLPTLKKRNHCPLPSFALAAVAVIALLLVSCDTTSTDDSGPNAPIGGTVTTGYTNVGDMTDVYTDLGKINPAFDGLKDSVVVIKNDNGNVTWFAQFTFDTSLTLALDTLLGMQSLPADTKMQVLDTYLKRYGATLDTTDKDHMKITVVIKGRVTSDGIQEYMTSNSESKPFTIIRFNANVGDEYEMTRASDGTKIERKVTYHSTTDDYPMAFWNIKVFKTEETSNDPLIKKMTYITNHKFGLVGIQLEMLDGTTHLVTVWPPNL